MPGKKWVKLAKEQLYLFFMLILETLKWPEPSNTVRDSVDLLNSKAKEDKPKYYILLSR